MEDIKISAAWFTYQKKMVCFFEYDSDVKVEDFVPGKDGEFILPIRVSTAKKALALQRILVPCVDFGNVRVSVRIECDEIEDTIKTAFAGNCLVQDITSLDIPGRCAEYVRLKPEVIQFLNDDISSYTGTSTFLAENIARDIFDLFPYHGYACTVDLIKTKYLEEE